MTAILTPSAKMGKHLAKTTAYTVYGVAYGTDADAVIKAHYAPDMLRASAQAVLAAGGSLVVVRPGGKTPDTRYTPRGHSAPTRDMVLVNEAIAAHCNLAVAEYPGVQVIDIDAHSVAKPDKQGDRTLAAMVAALGPVTVDGEPTPTVRSPSGGEHIYVACDSPLGARQDAAMLYGRDIDLRGGLGHGYVLLPGSAVSVQAYTEHQQEAIDRQHAKKQQAENEAAKREHRQPEMLDRTVVEPTGADGGYTLISQPEAFVEGPAAFAPINPAYMAVFRGGHATPANRRITDGQEATGDAEDNDEWTEADIDALVAGDARRKWTEAHKHERDAYAAIAMQYSPREFLEAFAADRYEDDGDRLRRVGSSSRGGVRFYDADTGSASDGYGSNDRVTSDHSTGCPIAAACALRHASGYGGKCGFGVADLVAIFLTGEYDDDGYLVAEGSAKSIKAWADTNVDDGSHWDGLPGVHLGAANRVRSLLQREDLQPVEWYEDQASKADSKTAAVLIAEFAAYRQAGAADDLSEDRFVDALAAAKVGTKTAIRTELVKARSGAASTPEAKAARLNKLRDHGFKALPEYVDVTVTKTGIRPHDTMPNVRALLDAMGAEVRLNTMTYEVEFTGGVVGGRGFDAAEAWITSAAEATGMRCRNMARYLGAIAERNQYHPVRDLIRATKWDGADRIQTLCDTLVSTLDPALKRTLVANWSIGAVQAVLLDKPKPQQGVLTLQGGPQTGKSTWLAELASLTPGAFQESVKVNPRNRDANMAALRHWIIEEGEVDATVSKREHGDLKAWVTQAVDEMRLPYGRAVVSRPRRTAIAATVNPVEFLADPTGNRRWWTVPVTGITRLSGIGFDTLQYWAQIATLVDAGADHSLPRDALDALNEANAMHEHVDVGLETVLSYYGESDPQWEAKPTRWKTTKAGLRHLSMTEICLELGISTDRVSKESKAMTSALRKAGYVREASRSGRDGAVRQGYWMPTPASQEERREATTLGTVQTSDDWAD